MQSWEPGLIADPDHVLRLLPRKPLWLLTTLAAGDTILHYVYVKPNFKGKLISFGFQIGTLLEVLPVESLKEKIICNAIELEYFSTEVVALKNSLSPLCFDPLLDNVNV